MAELTVGQTLYMPPRRGSYERIFIVEKIGRTYATLDGTRNRCTIDGLMLDCGPYTPRQLYLSKAIYEEKVALDRAWRDLARHMEVRRPDGATLENIAKARALLMLGGKAP